jgi:hypothetical protein
LDWAFDKGRRTGLPNVQYEVSDASTVIVAAGMFDLDLRIGAGHLYLVVPLSHVGR